MAEENFGPIAAITPFRTDDEAIERANACDMGLSAYAFTRSPKRARRTDRRTEGRHGRDQLLCTRGIGSAIRRHQLFRHGTRRRHRRHRATISTSNSHKWCFESDDHEQTQATLVPKGKPTINGWCSIGNAFTAEIMAAQGYDSDDRRRAAWRARLCRPAADAAGDARVRRRADGARAVAASRASS